MVCIIKPIPGKLLLRWEVLEGDGVQRRIEGGGESASTLEEDGRGRLGGCLELRISLVLSLLSLNNFGLMLVQLRFYCPAM